MIDEARKRTQVLGEAADGRRVVRGLVVALLLVPFLIFGAPQPARASVTSLTWPLAERIIASARRRGDARTISAVRLAMKEKDLGTPPEVMDDHLRKQLGKQGLDNLNEVVFASTFCGMFPPRSGAYEEHHCDVWGGPPRRRIGGLGTLGRQ